MDSRFQGRILFTHHTISGCSQIFWLLFQFCNMLWLTYNSSVSDQAKHCKYIYFELFNEGMWYDLKKLLLFYESKLEDCFLVSENVKHKRTNIIVTSSKHHQSLQTDTKRYLMDEVELVNRNLQVSGNHFWERYSYTKREWLRPWVRLW